MYLLTDWTRTLTGHKRLPYPHVCILQVGGRVSTIVQHLFTTPSHTLNSPLSGTTRVSRHQKGKTNLDFNEARDSEWQWHQLGHMQVCTSLQTDNHTSTEPLSFYRLDALPAAQPTASKHWRQPQHHFYLISFLLQFNMIYSSQNCRLSHISFAVM